VKEGGVEGLVTETTGVVLARRHTIEADEEEGQVRGRRDDELLAENTKAVLPQRRTIEADEERVRVATTGFLRRLPSSATVRAHH